MMSIKSKYYYTKEQIKWLGFKVWALEKLYNTFYWSPKIKIEEFIFENITLKSEKSKGYIIEAQAYKMYYLWRDKLKDIKDYDSLEILYLDTISYLENTACNWIKNHDHNKHYWCYNLKVLNKINTEYKILINK